MTMLKERTKLLHADAELSVDLPRRLQSLDTYAQLLARLHGFYGPLENQIDLVADDSSDTLKLAQRRKAYLVREDLRVLGWTTEAIESIAECPTLPQLSTWADVLGCLYVLEGSTLGGQIIRREVDRKLKLTSTGGCAFFNGYGESTGAKWHAFCQVVSAYAGACPNEAEDIIRSAGETFRCFAEWVRC